MRALRLIAVLLLVVAVSCKKKEQEKTAKKEVIETVSAVEFKKLMTAGNAQLVDVRTPEEFEAGYITNAKLINIKDDNFNTTLSKTLNKDQPVFVYCKAGGRSNRAAEQLKELGFTKVYNLDGGFDSWKEQGLEISAYK